MSRIRAYVESIIYQNSDNHYTVLSLSEAGESFTAVGYFPYIDQGDTIEAEGNYTIHPVYGKQFSVESYTLSMPDSADAIERYLAAGAIKGIGEALAKRIVKAFGDDTFRIMEEEVLHGPFSGLNIEPPFTRSTPMFADDRRIYPVYEQAAAKRIPVLIMSGGFGDVPLAYCHPSHLETVATDFPDLVIVSPHACWPYGRELIQLALRKPHIYLEPDIYSMGLPGWEDYMLAAGTILQDQFLFGSAHPTLPMEGCVDFYKKQNFSQTVWEKIMWENARRVLNHKKNGTA